MNQIVDQVKKLNELYSRFSPEDIIKESLNEFGKKIVYVCSFGTESAVILNMIASIDKDFPIFLLNTKFLFPETLIYKDQLLKKLDLRNCTDIFPDSLTLRENDPYDDLWKRDVDKCCNLRKVEPLEKKLNDFTAWISGRKSYHKGEREKLDAFEVLNDKVVVNPLINIQRKDIDDYFRKNNLPDHPLLSKGYLSIGCVHCTSRVRDPNDIRSGRWKDFTKTECGIHLNKKNN